MFKNIIAAFAALALLPSVGLATTSSLSKSSDKTFTYVIRANDTDATTLLSTNGADECSYVAQLSGATLTLTGDTSSSVAASGSGTIATTGGQFKAQFNAVSTSNVTVVCTPGGAGGSSYDDTAIQAQVTALEARTTLIDADADGVYEYVKFPQDFDGDGTTWQTCDCGGGTTPAYDATYICGTFRTSDSDYTQVDYSAGDAAGNPAECRFEGQRVWDDASDDLNALNTQTTVGTVIDFEPGTFVMKGGDVPTSDSGVHVPTQCWDSTAGTYSDTCQTDADGNVLRTRADIYWSNMQLTGSGVDSNGDIDLKYDGTMFVTNSGPRTFWNTNTVNNGMLRIGHAGNTANSSSLLLATTIDDDKPATLCLASAFVGGLEEGDLYQLTTTHAENGMLNRTFSRVTRVTANACGAGGLEVVFGGANQFATDQMPDTTYQTWFGKDLTTSDYITEIDESKLSHGINLSRVWFTHLDYAGAGGCNPDILDGAACDTGVVLDIGGGFNHRVSEIGIIQTAGSFGSGQVINTLTTSAGAIVENSVFRYNQGGLIDVAQYMRFSGNIVSDNALLRDNSFTGSSNFNMAALVRMQGDNYIVEGNTFERNVAPIEGLNAQTQASNGVVQMMGFRGKVTDNVFRMNAMTCIHVAPGAREMLIADNTLQCGSLNSFSPEGSDVRDRAYAIVINSKSTSLTGDITIRANRFTGLGGHYMLANQFNFMDPRAHVLFTGNDFNTSVDTAGDLVGAFLFQDNEFNMYSDQFSVAVLMRVNSANSDGDPDAERLIFDGNRFNQGNMFGLVRMSSGNGSASGILNGLDPDDNADGTGLPQCGVNFVDGTAVLDFENELIDDRTDVGGTISLSNGNLISGVATPLVDQCDSWLTP